MVSQEFLDLSIMVLKESYNVWRSTEEVLNDMETYFDKKYDEEKVKEAVDTIINESHGNIIEIPDDYEY